MLDAVSKEDQDLFAVDINQCIALVQEYVGVQESISVLLVVVLHVVW